LLKRFLSVSLIVLLLNLVGVIPAYANSQDEAQARSGWKARAGISKLGTGESARVDLKLRDGRKVKGYIREAGADSFVVVDDKTGTAQTITYPQVKEIKGNNLATGAKVAYKIGAVLGIALGLSILLAVVLLRGER
jgi:hypothetical protein